MTDNPVKRIRKENNLTQEAVASLANVTTQVITRCEAGTLTEIPVDVLRTLAYLSGDSTVRIIDDYEHWVETELRKVELPDINNTETEWFLETTGRFNEWLPLICKVNDVPGTIHSLAGLLKIHPYVLDKWSKGRMKEVPKQLIERIKQIRKLQNG